MAIMVPTPRGTISNPASATPYPPSVCSQGASSAELDSSTMPTENITRSPATKLRSRKILGMMNGFSAVKRCTTNK